MTNYYLLSWGLVVFSAVIDVVAVIIIKARLNFLGPINFGSINEVLTYCVKVVSTLQSFTATFLLLISPIFYGFALSRLSLSTAYPLIIAFTAISLVLASIFILNEAVTFNRLLGLAIIIVGVFFVYLD